LEVCGNKTEVAEKRGNIEIWRKERKEMGKECEQEKGRKRWKGGRDGKEGEEGEEGRKGRKRGEIRKGKWGRWGKEEWEDEVGGVRGKAKIVEKTGA